MSMPISRASRWRGLIRPRRPSPLGVALLSLVLVVILVLAGCVPNARGAGAPSTDATPGAPAAPSPPSGGVAAIEEALEGDLTRLAAVGDGERGAVDAPPGCVAVVLALTTAVRLDWHLAAAQGGAEGEQLRAAFRAWLQEAPAHLTGELEQLDEAVAEIAARFVAGLEAARADQTRPAAVRVEELTAGVVTELEEVVDRFPAIIPRSVTWVEANCGGAR